MRINRALCLLAIGGLLLTPGLFAQHFVTPLQSISGVGLVVTVEGKEIPCEIRSALFGMNGLASLTVRDTVTGEKLKFKAEQVARLRIKIDALAKMEMLADKTSNLKKLRDADFSEITDREYAYYDQVQIPGKDHFVLTQLLNPGFDSKIRVYDKPMAKTGETEIGGIAVSGGQAKAYYVIRDGVTTEITRGKYAKAFFPLLFSDCPDLVAAFPDPEFADFAEHVLYFEKFCH
jgi:hypothetical protein